MLHDSTYQRLISFIAKRAADEYDSMTSRQEVLDYIRDEIENVYEERTEAFYEAAVKECYILATKMI